MGWACIAGLGVACVFAASGVTTGCTTHQCDSDFVNIDDSTGTTIGDLQVIAPGWALWESSPVEGTWIDFPGQRTYYFGLPPYFTPVGFVTAAIATNPTPNDPDDAGTYVLAGGQLAEVGPFVNGGFLITNGTCAEYFLYASVMGTYLPPPPPAPDDAGAGD